MREEAGVRSLSPSTTPDAGPRPREGKGVGMIASTDRDRPALRIAGCPIQPTTFTQGAEDQKHLPQNFDVSVVVTGPCNRY